MPPRVDQIYEPYWSYTAAKTDLDGNDFIAVLKDCIEYFDTHRGNENYEDLQTRESQLMGISSVSTRKMINQLVKLGFLKPNMEGYNPEAVQYANATTTKKRQILLSKIVYQYSNFNNSMTSPDFGGQGQINFFLKTLEEVGRISDKELTALMTVNVNDYPKGYLNGEELNDIYQHASADGFVERKYNQISHLKNLLGRLDDLKEHDGVLYFKTDAKRLFGDEDEARRVGRDSFLQRVYKSELEEESTIHFESDIPMCMLEGLAYPVLIASHIKPYQYCSPEEAFDYHNGLLLSKNFDALFDLGFISFDRTGTMMASPDLSQDVISYVKRFSLPSDFINPRRMVYMGYHRENVFKKRYSIPYIRKYNLI